VAEQLQAAAHRAGGCERARQGLHEKKERHRDDALAEHYFDRANEWVPGEMTYLLAVVQRKSNWGIAHCSYRRRDPEEARGWEHAEITRNLAGKLLFFSRQARYAHLDRHAADAIERECSRAFQALPVRPDDPLQIMGVPFLGPPGSVATPMRSVYAPDEP
jgi:hypothetical protein